MFCVKCGTALQEDARFCSVCGTVSQAAAVSQAVPPQESQATVVNRELPPQVPQENVPPQAPQQLYPQAPPSNMYPQGNVYPQGNAYPQAPQGNMYLQPPVSSGRKKLSPKYIAMIAGGAAALVLAIVLIAVFAGGGSPESAALKYVQAAVAFDYDGVVKYCAYDVDEYIKAEYAEADMSQREFNSWLYHSYEVRSVKALFDQTRLEIKQEYRDEYGRNYKISFEVIDIDVLSKSQIRDKKKEIERDFDYYDCDIDTIIRIDQITEMAEVEIEANISGSEGEDRNELVLTVVKINGKWRVLDDVFLDSAF